MGLHSVGASERAMVEWAEGWHRRCSHAGVGLT